MGEERERWDDVCIERITEVEHPRVNIYTYSSAYWQLPLRMYRHIRRLYDPPVQPFIGKGCT